MQRVPSATRVARVSELEQDIANLRHRVDSLKRTNDELTLANDKLQAEACVSLFCPM